LAHLPTLWKMRRFAPKVGGTDGGAVMNLTNGKTHARGHGRVARGALRAAVSVPTPAARGPLAGRRAARAAPAREPTVPVPALAHRTGGRRSRFWSPRKRGGQDGGGHSRRHRERYRTPDRERFKNAPAPVYSRPNDMRED